MAHGHLAVLVHNTYRDTFFKAFPQLRGKVWGRHRVERVVLHKYPGRFTPAELDELWNLRGIPKGVNSKMHLSRVRRAWNMFYERHKHATRADMLRFAEIVDDWILKGFAIP